MENSYIEVKPNTGDCGGREEQMERAGSEEKGKPILLCSSCSSVSVRWHQALLMFFKNNVQIFKMEYTERITRESRDTGCRTSLCETDGKTLQ